MARPRSRVWAGHSFLATHHSQDSPRAAYQRKCVSPSLQEHNLGNREKKNCKNTFLKMCITRMLVHTFSPSTRQAEGRAL